ncbi:MAG: hypothetical protein ACI87O_000075 [Planctomycetota bacterium]|jgi:hypothetical protein
MAVVSLVTLAVWRFAPHWVARFDHWASAEYLTDHLDSIEQAKELLAQNTGQGIADLELALQEFPKAHKGGRLFAPMQKAILELARAHQKEKQWSRAIEAAALAYRNDDKDIRAHRLWVECLLATDATRAEGYRELGKLVHKFPAPVSHARNFVEMALQNGDFEAAGMAGMRHFLSTGGSPVAPFPKTGWLGWWKAKESGKGFGNDRQTQALVELQGDRLTIHFRVPVGQSALRLDLPTGIELGLQIESFQALSENGDLKANLRGLDIRSHHMTFSEDRIETQSESDPWFTVELPNELAGSSFEFQMICKVDGAPGWLRQALTQSKAVEETYLLAERGRHRPVQTLRDIQLRSWLHDGLSFEWMEKADGVSLRPDPKINGRYNFNVDLELRTGGGVWKLLQVPCYRWQVGGLKVDWVEVQGTLTPRGQSMTHDSAGVWTSVWVDSEFTLELDAAGVIPSASTVSLSGWIQ